MQQRKSLATTLTNWFTLSMSIFLCIICIAINITIGLGRYHRERTLLDRRPRVQIRRGLDEIGPRPTTVVSDTPEIQQYMDTHKTIIPLIYCDPQKCMMMQKKGDTVAIRDITQPIAVQEGLFRGSVGILCIASLLTYLIGTQFTKHGLSGITNLSTAIKTIGPDQYQLLDEYMTQYDEIAILAQGVKKSYQQIAENMSILANFVSHASHEQKTPLTVLRTSVQMLAEAIVQKKYDLADPYIKKIIKTVDAMHLRIDGLLSLTRREHTTPTYATFSLSACVRDVIETIPNMHHLSVLYAPKKDYIILADEGMVQCIVSNILGNAFKYTEAGNVTVLVEEERSGGVCMTVVDTGPGIPIEHHEQSTKQFWKKDSNTDGQGIGLYLAALLAKKMGWTMEIDKKYIGGTKRIINIPKNPLQKKKI